ARWKTRHAAVSVRSLLPMMNSAEPFILTKLDLAQCRWVPNLALWHRPFGPPGAKSHCARMEANCHAQPSLDRSGYTHIDWRDAAAGRVPHDGRRRTGHLRDGECHHRHRQKSDAVIDAWLVEARRRGYRRATLWRRY